MRVCDFVLYVALLLTGQVWTAVGFMFFIALEELLEQGELPHYKLRVR